MTGRAKTGRAAVGRATVGQATFRRATFGRATFGLATIGRVAGHVLLLRDHRAQDGSVRGVNYSLGEQQYITTAFRGVRDTDSTTTPVLQQCSSRARTIWCRNNTTKRSGKDLLGHGTTTKQSGKDLGLVTEPRGAHHKTLNHDQQRSTSRSQLVQQQCSTTVHQRSTLNTQQLCPALSKYEDIEGEGRELLPEP